MDIIRAKKRLEAKHLKFYEIIYLDRNKKTKVWNLATRQETPRCMSKDYENPDAVMIVPYHLEEKKLVMIKEYRTSLACFEHSFPAGLLDCGENFWEAAARELEEETGLQITKFLKYSPLLYNSTGLTDEAIVLVYVSVRGQISTKGTGSSEDITPMMVSQSEAIRLLDDKSIRFGAKAWVILSQFAETGKF